MTKQYVWCKTDECRIPAFRCVLCRNDCYAMRGPTRDGEVNPAFEVLRNSGRFKEFFVMKRKEPAESRSQLSILERSGRKEEKEMVETAQAAIEPDKAEQPPQAEAPESAVKAEVSKPSNEADPAENESSVETGVFLLEDGRIKAFAAEEYTTSTLYQALETFSVECRLVRPEEPGNMVFEGKKPSRKTVPIVVKKSGECLMLNSWEELEAQPMQLSDARDVVGAIPVKQVFVLKRK